MGASDIEQHPIHLGLGATASAEPVFTGEIGWYEAYERRHAADGAEGRLVSRYRFDEPWTTWEMHPRGAEVVLCTEGRITLHQEHADGTRERVVLTPGQYAINPAGTWHTADVDAPSCALFITAGQGTQHRPR